MNVFPVLRQVGHTSSQELSGVRNIEKADLNLWCCSALGTHGKFTLMWFTVAFSYIIRFATLCTNDN